MQYKRQKGFTLIEMLVVIVVIGILATIVLVSVSSGRKKAQATKAKTDMVELSKAFEMAASAGCRTVTFDANGQLTCTPAGADKATIYATLSTPPPGITYNLQFKTETATNSGSGWSAVQDTSVNGGYSFRSSGFSGANGGDIFSCNDGSIPDHDSLRTDRSGCFCSVTDGCSSTQ